MYYSYPKQYNRKKLISIFIYTHFNILFNFSKFPDKNNDIKIPPLSFISFDLFIPTNFYQIII